MLPVPSRSMVITMCYPDESGQDERRVRVGEEVRDFGMRIKFLGDIIIG